MADLVALPLTIGQIAHRKTLACLLARVLAFWPSSRPSVGFETLFRRVSKVSTQVSIILMLILLDGRRGDSVSSGL